MPPAATPPALLFGAPYSVYTRIVRLALEEKGLAYRLVETDIFSPSLQAAYRERHPFSRIPAFELDGFRLYEAGAIARFIDDLRPDPRLRPADARDRARMNQAISILDSYGFRPLVLEIFVERVTRAAPDEARIAAALGPAETCLDALEGLVDADFLTGAALTLADLHAVPMLAYFRLAPEGREMLGRQPRLAAWWNRMEARPSVAATRFPREAG